MSTAAADYPPATLRECFFRVRGDREVRLDPRSSELPLAAWRALAALAPAEWPRARALHLHLDASRMMAGELAPEELAAIVRNAALLRCADDEATPVPIYLYLAGLYVAEVHAVLRQVLRSGADRRFRLVEVHDVHGRCGLEQARLFAEFALGAGPCLEGLRLDDCFGTLGAPDSDGNDVCVRVLAAAQAAQAGCNLVLHANHWSARGWALWFGAAHGSPTQSRRDYLGIGDDGDDDGYMDAESRAYERALAPLDACLRRRRDENDAAALPTVAAALGADGEGAVAAACVAAGPRDADCLLHAAQRGDPRLLALRYLRAERLPGPAFGVLAFCSNLRVLHVTQHSDLRGADLAAAFRALPQLEVLVCAARMDRAALPALAALAARPALGVLNVLPEGGEPAADEWDAAGAAWVQTRADAKMPPAAVMVWLPRADEGAPGLLPIPRDERLVRGTRTRRAMQAWLERDLVLRGSPAPATRGAN